MPIQVIAGPNVVIEVVRTAEINHIKHKVALLKDYAKDCAFREMAPLRCETRALAEQIRDYRRAHKFYDCV